MRVTNTMMQNNALINMNKNKENYNNYLEEYTTQKKIQKASDNPMIAVRSLKFRTNIIEANQFAKSNIKDAQAWMTATEDALTQVSSIYTTLLDSSTQGANDTLEPKDRATILASMKQNVGFIYEQQANTDNAGRYIFAGYRTNVPLIFKEDINTVKYEIEESIDITSVRKFSYEHSKLEYDPTQTAAGYAQNAPTYEVAYKAMVSYDKIDSLQSMSYVKSDGSYVGLNIGIVSATDDDAYSLEAYNTKNGTNCDAVMIKETGEIIFSEDVFKELKSGALELKATYSKTEFKKNDIRPEHYFDCVATDLISGDVTNYKKPEEQKIRYEINFSQDLQVNTLARDAFSLSVGRGVDAIGEICTMLDQTEASMSEVAKLLADTDENDVDTVNALKELSKQLDSKRQLQNSMLQTAFSTMITTLQNAQDKLNKALADHGSRDLRLTMTANKLDEQITDFNEALSENEDANLGEAYIKYNQADMLYQATLQATSKVLGNSLLDFI